MQKLNLIAILSLAILGRTFAADGAAIAKHAQELMQKYCYKCHNPESEDNFFNAIDRKSLITTGKGNPMPYLTPGKPEASMIWLKAASGDPAKVDMPPGNKAKMTKEEAAVLTEWIKQGAPEPPPPTEIAQARKQITELEILRAIRDHVLNAPVDSRKYLRFFSIANLHNAPPNLVDARELRLTRAALSKSINSLTWVPDIVLPQPVDKTEETIYAIDLRDLDWDQNNRWNIVAEIYPYGLSYTSAENADMKNVALQLKNEMDTELFYVRADWFCTIVTQGVAVKTPDDPDGKKGVGPYHQLLGIPENAMDLEHKLGVNIQKNFDRDRLIRAGFNESKVSKQNRLVERHSALYGAYWKSYDFKPADSKEHNLFSSPLGPPGISRDKYSQMEFTHDGGEIVFNLPNGLQGYMLIDGKDNRINSGPIEVVSDSEEITGSPLIINGLSCLHCHDRGMKAVTDKVRANNSTRGDARSKVERLYAPVARLDKLIEKDQQRFLRALEEATLPFLNAGSDQGKKLSEFPEPVGIVAKRYLKPLNFADMTRELGVTEAKLAAVIQNESRLNALKGVTPQGGSINRDVWHGRAALLHSLFQKAARSLDLGAPYVGNM